MADDAPDTDGARHPLSWAPNALTLARVALAPAILLALLLPGLGRPDPLVLTTGTAPAAGLLLLAGALDWLDGRLARALKAQSAFGRFWDPVADKLVIGAALIGGAFAVRALAFLLPAALLLWRDAMVTWLRTQPRHAAATAAPSALAKWKTTLEYAALITLYAASFLADAVGARLGGIVAEAVQAYLVWLGIGALWLAAALSLWTGWAYFARSRKP